ncbi:hypothetical protein [Chthonobacter rhizosphaerae]|uniref:capsular polysaccharide export protein, LipB/KpsS family n=1 Tax=Chthonobacter rhizosphaerae TaxID=2735553 RepID=UPI0015EFA95B|nr:hypothetical protein [Chthonobacter rhizosphaerae]
MTMDKVAQLVERNAPSWLKRNARAVKLYKLIFERNRPVANLKRRYYLSICPDKLNALLIKKPDVLFVFCDDRDIHFSTPIQAHSLRIGLKTAHTSLSALCNAPTLEVGTVLQDPNPVKAALVQLSHTAKRQRMQLVVVQRDRGDRFFHVSRSFAQILGITFVKLSDFLCPPSDKPELTYWPYIPERRQHFESTEVERFESGLQFICGLEASRSVFLLWGGDAAADFRTRWNEFLVRLVTLCDDLGCNLIIVEDSAKNTLDNSAYNEISKSQRAAIFSGLIIDDNFKDHLYSCSRTIVFGAVCDNLNGVELNVLLERSHDCLQETRGHIDQFGASNETTLTFIRDLVVDGQSTDWDFGSAFGLRLCQGQITGSLALAQSAESRDVIEGVQKYIVPAFDADGRLDGGGRISTVKDTAGAAAFMQWGASESNRRRNLRRNAKISGSPLLFVEDGFVRSVEIGAGGSPGLSFFIDDLSPYYDARRWSRMERTLASNWEINETELDKVRMSIAQLRKLRISKYNHAPEYIPPWATTARPVYLLIDQRFGDQSVICGLANESSFRRMVVDAVTDTKEPLVVLKRHPDGTIGGKGSFFTKDVLGEVIDHPSIILHDEEINPYSLFALADEVRCVTSGMGFEAIIAGKPVMTYGAPFYSGWGLTADKIRLDWRAKKRTREEVFYVAYLSRAVYYDPDARDRTSLASLCDVISRHRDMFLKQKQLDV